MDDCGLGTFLLVRPHEKLWLRLLGLLGLGLGLALGLTLTLTLIALVALIALINFRGCGLTGKYHGLFYGEEIKNKKTATFSSSSDIFFHFILS